MCITCRFVHTRAQNLSTYLAVLRACMSSQPAVMYIQRLVSSFRSFSVPSEWCSSKYLVTRSTIGNFSWNLAPRGEPPKYVNDIFWAGDQMLWKNVPLKETTIYGADQTLDLMCMTCHNVQAHARTLTKRAHAFGAPACTHQHATCSYAYPETRLILLILFHTFKSDFCQSTWSPGPQNKTFSYKTLRPGGNLQNMW